MPLDFARVRQYLGRFDFPGLFTQALGWDRHKATLEVAADGQVFTLTAVAEKRGIVAYRCPAPEGEPMPPYALRRKIEQRVAKSVREHLIIFTDAAETTQIWQWVKREHGGTAACREHTYHRDQPGDALIQKLQALEVTLEEEEALTLIDTGHKVKAAFDVDRVTKRFYERFKTEHAGFLKFIKGFPGPVKLAGKTEPHPDLQWYTSLMLNRLMFVYFIQKKGFLDGDTEYLRSRLKMVRNAQGKDKFQSFYRYFLLRLFHDGLGTSPADRGLDPAMEKLLGRVPYLDGGFFEVHELERRYTEIDIPDRGFEKLFDFFDQYQWHLDERPLRKDNEINPDVVGYIFEKYVNQKQMGAYYTKEDITEYISKNTIIPYLFDAAKKKCAIAFQPDGALWRLLRDDPDRYIYPAVRHGVIRSPLPSGEGQGEGESAIIPLPADIAAGLDDVARREGWNRRADAPYALPTETWREHVARRRRCLEVREKLRAGEVSDINDLVTLNLDIWQFARDAILNTEGPELLRAFWKSIEKVTVLDPTCGSGAFLFAALRILETLYGDCLERMARFVEESDGGLSQFLRHAGDDAPSPTASAAKMGLSPSRATKKYSDFKAVLAQLAEHPNERYFILKTIIINNLYGVDIMEEAVEICKLRLFLKLAAQVETVDQIEPLPDVDFNIRAGNTLVGYTSLDEIRRAAEREASGQKKLMFGDVADAVQRIEEEAALVEKAFRQFRAQQTTHGGKVTAEDKQQLRARLASLDDELDRYLANEYGVNVEKPKDFAAWKASHEPFHWFVDFYGIMNAGGFDVIIGNPPYVEYSKVRNAYTIQGYATQSCGNLYAFVWERCLQLANARGTIGMIQPVAAVCTDGYQPLQALLRGNGMSVVSNFNDRPSKLFDGLEHIRLCIVLQRKGAKASTFSSTYSKWQAIERSHLFDKLSFIETTALNAGGAMAKIGMPIERSLLARLQTEKGVLGDYERDGQWKIYYTRKLSHFVQILDFIPTIKDERGQTRRPSELKEIAFGCQQHRDVFLSILNSSLFYWLLTVFSDCRNLNRRDIGFARFDLANAEAQTIQRLQKLCTALMAHIRANAKMLTMQYKRLGELRIQCTYPKMSKHILNDIDRILAQHYGFTDEELDFIINYDIKYRMGADGGDAEDK